MGLDMYAYTLKAELIDNHPHAEAAGMPWVTDVPVFRLARRAVGFIDLSNEEFGKLTDEDKENYIAKRRQADADARESGLIDPDFAYWRKFNHLHGWMHRLYVAKGGKDEQFNCNTVRLMPADLDRLLLESRAGLPYTPGFFFGGEEIHPDDSESIREFVVNARAAIREGKAVFYDSWW